MPELVEVFKLQWPKDVPLDICVRCKTFDYSDKTKEETIAHMESCNAGQVAPAVTPFPPVEASNNDQPHQIEEVPSEDDQPPRPIFKVMKCANFSSQLDERCNRICAQDRSKFQDEILSLKARNNRLVDELFWTKKMVDCQKYYSRLPTEELILMSVDQERARARDDRLAHEVLPETQL